MSLERIDVLYVCVQLYDQVNDIHKRKLILFTCLLISLLIQGQDTTSSERGCTIQTQHRSSIVLNIYQQLSRNTVLLNARPQLHSPFGQCQVFQVLKMELMFQLGTSRTLFYFHAVTNQYPQCVILLFGALKVYMFLTIVNVIDDSNSIFFEQILRNYF